MGCSLKVVGRSERTDMLRFTKQVVGGLMVAQSGPGGGYRLALPPSALTVGRVIRVLERPLAIVSCMANHGDCAQASRCTLRNPARKLQAAITDLLDTMTLAELTGDDVPAALAAQR
jgi:Rrf2 family protein